MDSVVLSKYMVPVAAEESRLSASAHEELKRMEIRGTPERRAQHSK